MAKVRAKRTLKSKLKDVLSVPDMSRMEKHADALNLDISQRKVQPLRTLCTAIDKFYELHHLTKEFICEMAEQELQNELLTAQIKVYQEVVQDFMCKLSFTFESKRRVKNEVSEDEAD